MDLLERDAVFEEMRDRLRQAKSGQGALLLIGGEAGAGKTALPRRFAAMARPSAIVLIGQCEALSTPRALAPCCGSFQHCQAGNAYACIFEALRELVPPAMPR